MLRHNAEVTNGGSGGGDTAVNHHWKIVWGDNIMWGAGGGRSRISPAATPADQYLYNYALTLQYPMIMLLL